VTALFAIPLMIGFVLMIAWVGATAVAATVDGWQGIDPDLRYGRTGRFVLAGMIGFGMAGMSSLYAGWPPLMAVGAAVVGCAGLIGVSIWLGPEAEA
jgi:hypothetical protein